MTVRECKVRGEISALLLSPLLRNSVEIDPIDNQLVGLLPGH